MAGKVLKITLENTHPPIWRRVIVPEWITFRDLHGIIQILFGWEGYHLHCFENYNQGFFVDCIEEPDPMSENREDSMLIDDYLEQLPWIRYTYDFGDDWNHKIVYEKTDSTYTLRHASLLKYKGDNPEEDCGGVGPWITYSEFNPIATSQRLEALEIPVRKKQAKKTSGKQKSVPKQKNVMSAMQEEAMDELFMRLLEGARANVPELKNASDEEILGILEDTLSQAAESGELFGSRRNYHDAGIQSQLDLLESEKPLTIVQSRNKYQTHLEKMEECTISDYLKYSRISADNHQKPEAVFADFLIGHVNILYSFFFEQEMKELLSFWDSYKSGKNVVEGEFQEAIAKCIVLGLIRLTGKRKLKLELCQEFEQVISLIDRTAVDQIYGQMQGMMRSLGGLLMAYVAMSFDQFYAVYQRHVRTSMEREDFERFIYWNGTMNKEITTFYNEVTGISYLALPGMKRYMEDMERRGITELFRVEPREISEIEMKKWCKGLNAVITEWDQFVEEMKDADMYSEPVILDCYQAVASGMSMTELICNDLDAYYMFEGEQEEAEQLAMECDFWHRYADLCLVTPIAGLNGYSREQYAEKFQAPLDYVPLFDQSKLKRKVTKTTHIFELPLDMQMEMLKAYRKGPEEYERVITRLCQKYRSNQALKMEMALITVDKITEENPDFVEEMGQQKTIYPWDMDELNLPKTETYVRETKKIGRNDPCPCGSGRKYKHCCGKADK